MSFISVPWDGEEHDMYEADWRRYHQQWGDGLISVGSRIVSQNDREFSISGMEGVIQGAYFRQVGTDSVIVPPPSSGQRYSQVALKYDPGANSVTLAVRHGGGGSNPIPPTPVQEPSGVWEMPIFEFGPAGDGALESLPREDLRTRAARIDYARTERQREIFGLAARHGDLVYDDHFNWHRWDRNVGNGGGWVENKAPWENGTLTSFWRGDLHYAIDGPMVTVSADATRIEATGTYSTLGSVPSGARPSRRISTVAWQNLAESQRFHGVEITPSGSITIYAGTDPIADTTGNRSVRFTVSYPRA